MAFVDPVKQKRLKFRALLTRPEMTVMCGGFSPILARVAQEAGFEAFFCAGSQMSGFLFGVPDTGVIGLRDIVDHARHIAAHTDIPILLDADTGFGNAANVWFSVQEIVRSGVAALQIEDQEAPKKSGTGGGRRCISIDEAVGKYRAAVAARNEVDPDFVICARTDSIGSEGGSFEDALVRCKAYMTDGGVDFVWLNAIENLDQIERACREIPGPLLVTGGGVPGTSLDDFAKRGLKIYMHPTIAATGALQGAWQALSAFKQGGLQGLGQWFGEARARPEGTIDFRSLNGNALVTELEAKFMPTEIQRDYANTWGIHSREKEKE
jgi:2-methylisocitrate lyase-like PEP mutase family enzyme